MDVGISQQHVHTRDAVDGLEEAVKRCKATRAVPLQSEATVLCFKLRKRTNTNIRWCFPLSSFSVLEMIDV